MSGATDKTSATEHGRTGDQSVANHLTPTELADEVNMKRREVISKCMEMGVPILNGRIDKTLFVSNLRVIGQAPKRAQTAS
jgi:hypothetical protein